LSNYFVFLGLVSQFSAIPLTFGRSQVEKGLESLCGKGHEVLVIAYHHKKITFVILHYR